MPEKTGKRTRKQPTNTSHQTQRPTTLTVKVSSTTEPNTKHDSLATSATDSTNPSISSSPSSSPSSSAPPITTTTTDELTKTIDNNPTVTALDHQSQQQQEEKSSPSSSNNNNSTTQQKQQKPSTTTNKGKSPAKQTTTTYTSNTSSSGDKSGKFLKSLWNLVKDSNMLFRLGLQSRSPVDILLEKENCTLEEILDEDDVLQEAKAHNSKLVAFLAKGENATKLIEYLTVDVKLDPLSFHREIQSTPATPTNEALDSMKKNLRIRDSMELSGSLMKELLANEENANQINELSFTDNTVPENASSSNNNDNMSDNNDATINDNNTSNSNMTATSESNIDATSSSNMIEDENTQPELDDNLNTVHVDEERLEKRILKYPRLAAEILCSDIEQLYAAIVGDKVLLSTLFGFLSSETPLNPTLAGYWIRVMRCLFQRRIFDLMKYIVTQDDAFAQSFVNHLNITGMEELLLKLTGCDITISRKDISMKDVSKWWLNHGLIGKLVAKLDPQYESEVHANVAKTLSELVKRSFTLNPDLEQTNVLAADIMSSATITLLMDKLMDNSGSILIEAIPLLTTLIDTSFDLISMNQNMVVSDDEDEDEDLDDEDSERHYQFKKLPEALTVIMSRLDQFVSLLKSPPQMDPICLSFGTLDPPLGETRLKIVEFLTNLYHTGFAPLEKELIRHNVLSVILDLFFQYEFNNILHNMLLKTVSFILSSESTEMKRSLFKDCRIIERIVEANKLNEHAIASKPPNKGMRKGYMGHLIIISNSIVTTAKSQQIVADMIQNVSGWKEFVESSLAERNVLESKQIGGLPGSANSAVNVLDDLQQEELDKQFQDFDDMIEDYDDDSSSSSDDEDDTMVKKTLSGRISNDNATTADSSNQLSG